MGHGFRLSISGPSTSSGIQIYKCTVRDGTHGVVLAVCLRCRRHSSGNRAAKLLQPCGHPIATAMEVMKALRQGKHPNPRFRQKGVKVELSEAPDILEDLEGGF